MSLPQNAPGASPAAQSAMRLRGIVFTALFAALFIAASYMKIYLSASGVPISLQVLAVMLAGGLLGAVYGFWSIFIVVVLTALGLPLMNGTGGWAQITGATGGFIWMFPVSALLIGWATDKLLGNRRKPGWLRQALLLVVIFVLGSLLLYVTGVPWLAHYSPTLDLQGAIDKGMLPYLPGDALKAVAATLIIIALRPLIPVIRPFTANRGNHSDRI